MQIKQAVNEKQSGGFGSSFLRVPLNLASFKNTKSIDTEFQSELRRRHGGEKNPKINKNQSSFSPASP